MRPLGFALLVVLLFSSPVLAGTVDDPEVTDPQDGLHPMGDVRLAWLDQPTDDMLGVHIETVRLDGPIPFGELGLRFRVNDTYWVVGYLDFPMMYQGGFICPGNSDDFDAESNDACASVDASFSENRLHLTIPLDMFDGQPGAQIAEPTAYAELVDGNDGGLDQTEAGRTFVLASLPAVDEPADAEQPSDDAAIEVPETERDAGPVAPEQREAPGGMVALLAACLAGLVVRASRFNAWRTST